MPRLPRLQYPGAIYHIVTRGDGRRKLFHDDGHFERFTRGLAEEVDRSGWIVIAYGWMPNHIHALIKTPQPNLCRGMQHWLSGYANWYAKRNRRTGHLNPPDPKLERLRDWVHGGEDFLKRTLAMASGEDEGANRRRRRRMVPVTVDAVLDATALQYGTSADRYCGYRSSAVGREHRRAQEASVFSKRSMRTDAV